MSDEPSAYGGLHGAGGASPEGSEPHTVTLVDKKSNGHISVIVNHFSKRVEGVPAARIDKISFSAALLVYMSLIYRLMKYGQTRAPKS